MAEDYGSHVCAEPNIRPNKEASRSHVAVGAVWEGPKGAHTQHCCRAGAEGRAGPNRLHADAMAPRQPCVGPTYTTPNLEPGAEALPPTPARMAWCRYKVHLRSLQVLKNDQVQCFGLEGCPVGVEATVRVLLVLCPDLPCIMNDGSLEVHYIAKRRSGEKGRWGLTDADGYRRTIWKWVEEKGLLLTGRYKAHRGPVLIGPHLLVLEVQPQPQAAAATDQTTGGLNGSLNEAGPSQPAVRRTPAARGTVGASSGLKRRRTGAGAGQAEGVGVAEPAPAQPHQEQERGPEPPPAQAGPAGAEWQPPPVAAPPPAGQEACRTAKATAGTNQGQSQQPRQGLDDGEGMETDGGAAQVSGSSVPSLPEGHVDAGGAAYEGDPVMPPPAAGPAHAGLVGSNGQDVADPMALTHEGPEVHLEVALGWAELIRTVFLMLDEHLPQKRQSKVVDAQMRFDQWCDGGEGLTHLQALAKAHTTVRDKCAHFSPEHKAKYLWKLVQKDL